ncbi:hypothetical protein NC653_038284 [Populus alba x Populus x berolinensis]|uniref:UBN2 domain-containing protein n=1 Tax=Populus alba x Populus x berolinensis TaxID=444605 RepID=A0AAD6LHT5_9ROSI|nr:hypothetical protein NC653_038284 [Populus alba x Populus x berolinensis]
MKANKSIYKMHIRFIIFVNENYLEKKIENKKIIVKILRSLPRAWEPKATAIEEGKKLKTLVKIN